MIEILFGESEAGAMKIALRREKRVESDVICLPLMLDIGDISQSVSGKYRRNLIYKMLYREQWGADEEMKAEMKALGNTYSSELKRLNEYLKKGETLRIWYSSAPYSLCGMMWLCSNIWRFKYKCGVYAVELPKLEIRGDCAVSFSSWDETEPEKFAEFAENQRRLPLPELRKYAFDWERLVAENAPLRAVVSGSVISVPVGFYDFLIRKYMDDKPVRQAVLIGRILGENPLGVGDWWYAMRIEHLIGSGRIKIVEDSDKKYARIICAENRQKERIFERF